MYAEVVIDRPIIKRDRRSFVDALEDADTPYPEVTALADTELPPDDNPLAVTFHYHLPPHLEGQVQPGSLVTVPFRTEQLPAIVVNLSHTTPIEQTRPIAALLDPAPLLSPAQLNLAHWLSAETLTPLAACLKLFWPPGIGRKEAALSFPRLGPKIDRTVELLISPEEIEVVWPTLGRPSKPAEVLWYLANLDDPLPALADVLHQTGGSREQVKSLAAKGWLEIIPKKTRLAVPPGQPADDLSETDQKLVSYLLAQKTPPLLDEAVAAAGVDRAALNHLLKKGRVTRLDEPERVTLTLPPAQLAQTIIELRGAQKQAQVLRLLAAEDGPVWVGWVYTQTQATVSTLKELAQAGLVSLDQARRWRDPLAGRNFTLDTPPTLSEAQQVVWQAVWTAWQARQSGVKPILLHGVTGSGKTEIYLRAIAAALKAGTGAILLVPEITLAAQTVARVAARFPGRVAVWHSALTPGERFDTWERVRSGELPIVVGPRSALFAPVKNLEVIVVDEEHEPAYKQRDRLPIFHARQAALELGRLSRALVIMGSATPDVVTYRQAQRGEFTLLTLPNRILAHTQHLAVQAAMLKRKMDDKKWRIEESGSQQLSVNSESFSETGGRRSAAGAPLEDISRQRSDFVSLPLPQVEVVDLREELKAGNRTIFSRALQEAIRDTLRREEQVILFLNRRGAATFVICRDCGTALRCPRCETTLTYHTNGELLICHYCGHREKSPERCPVCRSERIRYFGLGTQRVEEAVKGMFPQAQTVRWDRDTTRQPGSHDLFLEHFLAGRANVMVGTQMVAKGLDLPLVTLVGVVSADTAMYLPDFRAAERTFQLLMQVAGRAGRSPLGGRVIIQTYNPDQAALVAASRHDYLGFYENELAFRREQHYPPFKRLALLLYAGPGPERSAAVALQLAQRLRRHIERQGLPAVEIIGPTPGYVQHVRAQYRWQILLRAPDPAAVLRPLMPLPPGWRVDIDPVTLL